MATNHIPHNVVLLAAYMERIERGDDRHKGEHPLQVSTRTRLEGSRKRLQSSTTRVKDAEAELAQAREALRDDRIEATEATRSAREDVYSIWNSRNPVIKDYGLRPHRSGRPRKQK